MLQSTNYYFPSTDTTLKKTAGIVKAVGLFEKNPSQHIADYEMLTNERLLRGAFFESDKFKPDQCIRVDGATDEGPSYSEVSFYGIQV